MNTKFSSPISGTTVTMQDLTDGRVYRAIIQGLAATAPGGSSTQIQFNSAGSFGGSALLTFDGALLTIDSAVAFGTFLTGYFDKTDGLYIQGATSVNTDPSLETKFTRLASASTANRTATFPDKTGTVAFTSDITGTNSGVNTGDQTIQLTGDVTGSGTGTFAATIANGAVTLAKMANMATASLIYRKTAGSGAPEVNTLATLKTDMSLGNVENTALSTWAGSTSITTLGTIVTGVWSGTLIGVTKGGTGTSTQFTAGSVVFAGASGVYSQSNADLFWDNTNKWLGVGTNVPAYQLHICDESAAATRGLLISEHVAGIQAAAFTMRKSRGSRASPAAVASGDFLGFWGNSAYDGSQYRLFGSGLMFGVVGAVGANSIPVAMGISTGSAEGNYVARILVWSDGNVSIGAGTDFYPNFNIAAPGCQLLVVSDVTTEVGLIVRGKASQTADIIDAQNSGSTRLFGVGASGELKVSRMSDVTLVLGTKTIADATITANSRLLVTLKSANTSVTLGVPSYTLNAGVGYTLTSLILGTPAATQVADVSTYTVIVYEPA